MRPRRASAIGGVTIFIGRAVASLIDAAGVILDRVFIRVRSIENDFFYQKSIKHARGIDRGWKSGYGDFNRLRLVASYEDVPSIDWKEAKDWHQRAWIQVVSSLEIYFNEEKVKE